NNSSNKEDIVLSQSEEFVSNEHDNLTNSDNNNTLNSYNLVNSDNNNIEKFKNISKLPNLKAIKLVPLIKHSECIEIYHNNNTSKSELCEHIIRSVDSSTGNYIGYLATQHGITESSYNEKTRKSQLSQLQID
ncbi:11366_t:CDS:2, partial [Scutellospora calospora]